MPAQGRARYELDDLDSAARTLVKVRKDHADVLARLRLLCTALVPAHMSEAEFSRRSGVDRMTVRTWLGKSRSSRTTTTKGK
ncbi:MAG TPA: hypothetical protein VK735_40085 [Pseudonocardia sp.]|uniref:hypothetical protein n=1 Tax=Pseudonocardia sp. TaxID=60912 RepID=UPI002CB5C498|nr:hypothetical protein [Pseudonocardia sp.]HTF53685.1 hypothetical protein [Pseudonocardia sp.]